tara:strand:- start:1774 stop:2136 length:363 start_codon:yes stop_codon:yes gene_type:complete
MSDKIPPLVDVFKDSDKGEDFILGQILGHDPCMSDKDVEYVGKLMKKRWDELSSENQRIVARIYNRAINRIYTKAPKLNTFEKSRNIHGTTISLRVIALNQSSALRKLENKRVALKAALK